MNSRLRIAVLSFAHVHAARYLELLSGRDDVDLLGADPDRTGSADHADRGPAVAAALGIGYANSYDEAFGWQPDAVIICSENTRHRALVERAAAAGADVLCEKPLATTVDDAVAIVRAADRAGVRLMTAFPVRFAPSFAALQERVARGDLGEVLAVVATNNGKIPAADRHWFVEPELSGGGALVDHIVHCADLIDALLGVGAATVRAVSNRILHADLAPEVETGGLVTITYESGLVATIDCSWSQPSSAPTWGGLTFEVFGTMGSIGIDPFGSRVEGHGTEGPLWLPFHPDYDAAMLDEFVGSVREQRPPRPDGRAGLRAVEIMTAAQRSAQDGRVVPIREGSRP